MGGWAAVEQQTGIQASFMDAAYQTAKTNYDQTKAAGVKLGNYAVVGLNDDGSMQVMKGDGTPATVTRADVASGKYPGIAASDFDTAVSSWQSAKANLTSGTQWHFQGVDPATGVVTMQNNGTKEIKTLSAADAMAMPGANPLEIQQGIQQANSANFNNASVGSVMGFGGYQPVPYWTPQTAGAGAGPPQTPAPPPQYPPPPDPNAPRVGVPTQPAAPPMPPGWRPLPEGTGGPETPPTPTPPGGGGGTWGTGGAAGTQGTQGTATASGTTGPYSTAYARAAAMYTGGAASTASTTGAPPTPTSAPTPGGTNALTYQQLQQQEQARNTYYNYAKAAQNIQTADLAGRSRDTTGMGYGSITQGQRLAGQ
jgi:hypothetical protein